MAQPLIAVESPVPVVLQLGIERILPKRRGPKAGLDCCQPYCGIVTTLNASFMQAAENCSLVMVSSASAVVIDGSLVLKSTHISNSTRQAWYCIAVVVAPSEAVFKIRIME
jgi:hypothetical protein